MPKEIYPNCPRCGSSNVRLENVDGYTDLACGDCGYVLEEDYFRDVQYEIDELDSEKE